MGEQTVVGIENHTDSERRLHRITYVLKFIRFLTLFLIVTMISVGLSAAFGVSGVNPYSDALIAAFQEQFREAATAPALISAGLIAALIFGFVLLFYLAIVRVWTWLLRTLSALVLIGVAADLAGPAWELTTRSAPALDPFFTALVALGAVASIAIAADCAIAMWVVSRAKERSSFKATLDGRLVRGTFSYFNKMLDLPRQPFRSWRAGAAYVLNVVAAVILTTSVMYLATVGWIEGKAQTFFFDPGCLDADVRPCSDASRVAAYWVVGGLALSFVGLRAGALLQSVARRVGALSVSDVLRPGDNQFLLYLRPFDADDAVLAKPKLPLMSALLTYRPFPTNIEEELFDVADGYRPLIAVGKPGGRQSGATAHRVFFDDDGWRRFVLDKIQRAEAIAMVLSESEGVRWELDRVLEQQAVDKTIFFFGPKANDASVWRRIAETARATFSEVGCVLEFAPDQRAIAFYFEGNRMIEIVNDNWSAVSYRTAFSQFLTRRQQ